MSIKESGNELSHVNDIKVEGTEGGYVVLERGSWDYHFEVQK